MVPLNNGLQQGNVNRFRHIQIQSGTLRNYSGISRTLCKPGIFRTLAYLELSHIQNQRHIRNPGIFRTVIYSELSPTFTLEHFVKIVKTVIIIFASYNYFCDI